MAEVKGARPKTDSEVVVERAKDFWEKYGKTISIALGAVIVLTAGFLIYKKFIKEPKEKKSYDAVFKVQSLYDSLYSASGELQAKYMDSTLTEAEKVIKQYGSTKAGNLAKFMAGSIYVKKGAFDKAVPYLKDFDADAPQIQARAYKLLGDALSEQGKGKEAIDYYKKAAHEFEEDDAAATEALFLAGYLADKVLNDKTQAIELFKEVKTKYKPTIWSSEAEKYLAALGVYNAD